MNWQAAVETTVTGLGYDLVDCDRSPRGLLRVFIDHPAPAVPSEGPEPFITVDDCERVTRQLQHVLEVEGAAYERLEVSSPGLDRPLKKAADYTRFLGEQVETTLKVPFNGRKKFSGVLEAGAVEGGFRVVFDDGKAEQALDFTLDEVRETRLVPVLDFKGRRFAPQPDAVPDDLGPQAMTQEDHGGKNQ